MTDSTNPHNLGYLALFDPVGNKIEASFEDLLYIQAKSSDKALLLRVVNNRPGVYWLISDRLGLQAMLLGITISHSREENKWEIRYSSIVGSCPYEDLESTIRYIREEMGLPISENVARNALYHVTFRTGQIPGSSPLDLHSVRTREMGDMAQEMVTKFPMVNPTELFRYADKKATILQLLLATKYFCGEYGLNDREGDLLKILVPEDEYVKMNKVISQLGAEE
jgi:hypothetical protein